VSSILKSFSALVAVISVCSSLIRFVAFISLICSVCVNSIFPDSFPDSTRFKKAIDLEQSRQSFLFADLIVVDVTLCDYLGNSCSWRDLLRDACVFEVKMIESRWLIS
jgi:hypothetical protein